MDFFFNPKPFICRFFFLRDNNEELQVQMRPEFIVINQSATVVKASRMIRVHHVFLFSFSPQG